MIFAKIYSDGDDVVFQSVKKPVAYNVYIAGPYINDLDEEIDDPFTTISQTSNVAISAEAKEALNEMLNYTNPNFITKIFEGDLKLCYNYKAREGERGILCFAPEEGTNSRRINRYGKVCVCTQNGFDMQALNDMKVFGNEFLKELDISKPFDEATYYKNK